MKYFIILILCTNIVFSETLFQVKDSSDRVVLDVSSDGLRVLNQGDTVMVISSTEIKAVIDNSKALSRSFTVATSTSAKGQANVMEVTTDATTMREGNAGERYTDFSPSNIFMGLNSGMSSSGAGNVFIGNKSGKNTTWGSRNIFLGNQAGENAMCDASVLIGQYAGINMGLTDIAEYNIAIGQSAGSSSAGSSNIFIGPYAGQTAKGSSNTYLGGEAGKETTDGFGNVFLGAKAGLSNLTGYSNVFVGNYSGASNSAGAKNVFLGNSAGYNETGSNKLYIANSNTSTPLIKGTFPNTDLTFKAANITADCTYLKINTNPGEGTTPISYVYQGSVTNSTAKQYAFAINDALWVTSNAWIDGTLNSKGINAYVDEKSGLAANFSGNINVTGTVVKSKDEVISDHPTDPENKILTHSSVSSSEMLNVYSGNVILNGDGKAIVEMPEWFEAYNAEFRYQLTGIGISAPGLFISEELTKGRFSIGGGNPDMKVSWMVTAVRNDNYAKANPMQVVSEKKENEKGYYLTPEVFGKSKDMSIESVNEREAVKNIPE
jgi:hypothetical protein